MTLLLVRHAVALRRGEWKRPDHLRPLTPRGYDQADRLPEVLATFAVDRILSSPSVRCVETVQPLAAKLGLPIEEVGALAEGAGPSAAALLEGAGAGAVVVVCSHGDVIPDLLRELVPTVDVDGDAFACDKASTWLVDGDGAARYLPPPA
jgi:8-oxo-dGTP diphosphatase